MFNKFTEFKAFVEIQKGKKIKVLRLNNGREDTSKEFPRSLIPFAGIKRELYLLTAHRLM